MDFAVAADHSENQIERKRRKVLEPHQRTKHAVKHQTNRDASCNWRAWDGPKRLGKGGELKIGRRIETIQTTLFLGSGWDTEKSPGDLRKLVVSQTPMKSNQLTLAWKTIKGIIAGAVEYTDCISTEGWDPEVNVLDMTLNNQMESL